MTIHQLGADDWSLSDTKVEVENVVIAGRLSLALTGPHALATPIANDKLMWYVIMHLTFVVSAVMMGVLDKMSFASHRDDH